MSPLIQNNKLKFLIGHLYNRNGMATWCIEACRSLVGAGAEVILSVSPGLEHLAPEGVTVLTIDAFRNNQESTLKKIKELAFSWVRMLWPQTKSKAGTKIINQAFKKFGRCDVVLWNQTNLLCDLSISPQWVVGWAYPDHLSGYLKKINSPSDTPSYDRLKELLYWYRTDNLAYRKATGVLPVTRALTSALKAKGIRTIYAPPGTISICPNAPESLSIKPHLIIAARWLDEPRKKVKWMIEALATLPDSAFELSLVGEANPKFTEELTSIFPAAKFMGLLSRKELMQTMSTGDLLLFGSSLDDWGFVQVEAIANGLAVFAPRQMPSIEIIQDEAFLFEPDSQTDFTLKLKRLIEHPDQIQSAKNSVYKLYSKSFSSEVFAGKLLKTLEPPMNISTPPGEAR